MERIGEPVARATLLTVAMLVLAFAGTTRASSTVLHAASGDATVTGISPVTMSFPLDRLGDLGFDTWLRYQTEDGTAEAGADYAATSGNLKVPAGANAASIPVQVFGKSAFAPEKQFTLKLLGAAAVGPTPSFTERVSFAAGGTVTGKIQVADMNGDGKPDAIVPNNNAGSVSVLLDTTTPGSPTPSLAAPQSFAVGGGPEVATPRDVNGDGRPDLVVANGDDFSVLLNTTSSGASTLSFSSAQVFEAGKGPRLPVLEDFNGDGRPDLVVANDTIDEHAISVFFNTTSPGASTASFGARQFFDFFAPGFVLPTDVNGDGRPDLVISSQGGADEVVVILTTTPPGGSNLSLGSEADLPAGKLPNVVRAADVNGDGRPDLVVANNEGDSVSVLLNGTAPGASTPSFAPERTFAVGNEPRSVQAVDLNGDGRVDLITGNHGDHTLSALLNTTAPGTSAPSFSIQTVEAEPIPLGLVTADLNGDGRQDLIYTRESNKVLVSLNTTGAPIATAPSLATNQEAAAGGHPSSVAATDFNGDGKPDLVVGNRDDDTASVLLDTTAPGTLTPSFTAQQTFAVGDAPSALATADFNLDGKSDVVAADHGPDAASVLFNTTVPGAATPSFGAQQEFATGKAPSGIATADLNGDGKPDLTIANHDEDTTSVLLNTTAPGASTPSFAPQQAFATGNAPSAVATADLNGDGIPDLIVANEGADTTSVLLNTTAPGASTPSFAAQHASATGDGPTAVTTADLNGDGGPDVIAAGGGSDGTSVLLDTQYAASVGPASVTGIIRYAIPQITLNQSSLAFGGQTLGTGTTKIETLSNSGGADLAIDGIAIGGVNSTEFNQADSCPATLKAGSSCSISVTFEPNVGGGASALLNVNSNSPSSPDTVALSGIGLTSPPSSAHTLRVEFKGGGRGSVGGGAGAISCPGACSHAFADGARVALTATPASGSTFAGWSGDGCREFRTCQLTIRADTTLSARFEPMAVARLRIGKAQVKTVRSGLRMTARGMIAHGAHGAVRVKFRIRDHGRWVSVSRQAQIVDGNWRTRLSVAAADPHSPIYLSARFGGSPGFRNGKAKRRLQLR